ncbi:FliH/SctL family protein [Patulibacter sp. NPDC049589]|uniref:FliH/SctL family protein n=1 Tax=Patulibacter sp. NPDC049589 TaxID=3154731 RepID=UPI00343AF5C7
MDAFLPATAVLPEAPDTLATAGDTTFIGAASAVSVVDGAATTSVPAEFAFEPLEVPPAGADARPGRPVRRSPADELADARAEAERIREEARRDGFEAGHAAGMEQARTELEPAARALAEALQEAMTQGDQLAVALEREAVELAMAVAEKVVAGAVRDRPERVLDVITGALRGLVARRRITVLVNPDDVELVRERIGAITAGLGGVEHCEVQAERRVARGGALLRTPDGELDVRLDAKLRRAAEVLREVPA